MARRKKTANTITELFDLEQTKRSESSNVEDSFYQQFKGEWINGEWVLKFFETKKYKKKFDKINRRNYISTR